MTGASTTSTKALALLVVLMAAIAWSANGQNAVCMRSFLSSVRMLRPCAQSVSIFRPDLPTEACCHAIRLLGQPCLCRLINGPPISGVDRSLASQLPDRCTTDFEPCLFLNFPCLYVL